MTLAYTFNLEAAWIGILLGVLSGAAIGLAFHRNRWLGGYDSWPRRLLRLGHISFFGLALLNLAFALTQDGTRLAHACSDISGALLLVGAVTMPTVCFLAAWRQRLRHLFFIPVSAIAIAVGLVVFRALTVTAIETGPALAPGVMP